MKKIIFLFILTLSSVIYAQNDKIKITGNVYDDKGIPLAGVKIIYESKAFSTDFDGSFIVNVKDNSSFLTFSYIGFATQTITVGQRRDLKVTLSEATSKLDEIVVIGYGTQKRSVVTGSVAKVKSEKFENAPVSRLDQALQGKIAGVRIQNVSSQAGADTKVTVRGVSSLNADSNPLIVVDGQPMPDGFGALNTADVESVEVLKDAASAAIYGSRGANGVIIITTKSGKDGKTKFSFRNTTGIKDAYETYNVQNSTDYVERLYAEGNLRAADPVWDTAATAYGATIPALSKWQAQYAIEKDLLGGEGTDYPNAALRSALYQDYQFSVSGGSKKSKFFISTGYQKDEGLMLKSNFEKLNVRAKFDSELTDKLKISVNINPSNTKTEIPGTTYIDFVRFPSFLPLYHTEATANFINAQQPGRAIQVGAYAEDDDFANLVYTGVDPNGVPYTTSATAIPFTTANTNPMRGLLELDDNNNQFRFQGSVGLSYKIFKDLEFKTTESIYYRNSQRLQNGSTNALRIGNPNFANYTNVNYFDFLTENTLNYKKKVGDHDFAGLAGFTFQSTRTKSLLTGGSGFPSDFIQNLNFATVIAQPVQSDITVGLISFLGRVNYSYKDRYLLMATYRTDGSSLFDTGKKWGGFPAVSAGWVVSKENFMANINAINRLSFRASYGATGNNGIGTFLYDANLNNSNYVNGSGAILPGLANTSAILNNENITWERTFQTNLGFDLAVLSNRINLNVDVYQSETEKLLLQQSALLTTGSSSVITNAGSLKNRGFEVELSTVNVKTENFKWKTDFNISHVKNEITNLGDKNSLLSPTIDGRNGLNTYANVGEPLISFYGYQTNGIWNSLTEITDAGFVRTAGLIEVGGLKIVDRDGDKLITPNDRTIIGNPYPDFTWGITNGLSYKNIDLNFTIQGSQGGQLINGDVNYNETKERILNYNENRWVSPSNPGDGRTPYVTNGLNWLFTDNAIEDASYASLREVSLAYNLGKNSLGSLGLTGLRFSLLAQNLYFMNNKNYRGINIEARSNQTNPLIDGYQRGAFPIPRTFLFGIDVNF